MRHALHLSRRHHFAVDIVILVVAGAVAIDGFTTTLLRKTTALHASSAPMCQSLLQALPTNGALPGCRRQSSWQLSALFPQDGTLAFSLVARCLLPTYQHPSSSWEFGTALNWVGLARRSQISARYSAHVRRHSLVAGSGQVNVSSEIKEVGLKFVSLPPGKVVIKHVLSGTWADEQGVEAGSELIAVNGDVVSSMSREQFIKVMRGRPINMHLKVDAQELQREMTYTSSAAALLELIGPWVGGSYFDGIHMASAFHRLGIHQSSFDDKVATSPVLRRLLTCTLVALERKTITPRGVANIVWALGKLGSKATCFCDLFPALVEAVRDQELVDKGRATPDDFTVRHACNIFWATASLRHTAPLFIELIPQVLEWLAQDLESMDEQDVQNSLWACASLRKDAPVVYEISPILVEVARQKAQLMGAETIANVVWAAGVLRLGRDDVEPMMVVMRKEIAAKLDSLNPQALANACWGLAACGVKDVDLMTSISGRAIAEASTWSKRNAIFVLPQLVCSLAKLGLSNDEMLDVTATRLLSLIDQVPDWTVCALKWSYDRIGTSTTFARFRLRVSDEIARRGFDPKIVSSAQFGPGEWSTGA